MPERSILIVAVDGLRASALGALGNAAFATPALDHFAAESFVFDACFAPAAGLADVYRALWHSIHPLRPAEFSARTAPLPLLLTQCGYDSTLLTDAVDVAALAADMGFARCIRVEHDADRRADDVSQTALARLFAEACDRVDSTHDRPQFVWVHARGMYGPWDAPLTIQQEMLDEGDPPPVDSIVPPDLSITSSDDPDAAFRFGVAYAAQVTALDTCWAALDGALVAGDGGNWLVMLLGTRAFPLGEHRRVGGVDPRLYAEQLHVPWLVRFPDALGRLARSGALVSPLDVAPMVWEWTGDGAEQDGACDGTSAMPLVRSVRAAWREALVFGDRRANFRAIRTPAWSLRYELPVPAGEPASGSELFLRPDDRWEANDIATLCPEVVEALVAVAEDATRRMEAGEIMPSVELAPELRGTVR